MYPIEQEMALSANPFSRKCTPNTAHREGRRCTNYFEYHCLFLFSPELSFVIKWSLCIIIQTCKNGMELLGREDLLRI